MNTILVPRGKFTTYLVVASCHSVSNHVMHTTGLFCRHCPFFFSSGSLAVAAAVSSDLSWESLGLSSGLRVFVARSPVAPNRIEFIFRPMRASLLRTGSSLPVALHGRLSPAAVTFRYRSVDPDLTGTFTPLRRRLRSRTTTTPRGRGFA